MIDYENLLADLDNGNLSDYKAGIKLMSARGMAHFSYWLHFVAPDTYNEILITRAFLHNKLAYEVNNYGLRSKEKHSAFNNFSH